MTAAALNGHQLEQSTLPISLGRVRLDDLSYVRNSFSEGHKSAPGVVGMSWRAYKLYIEPDLHAVVRHPIVELRGAYLGPDIVGWLAYTRGGRVDAVHWVHTRFRVGASGEKLRRRGVMTALLDSAGVRGRIVYTWKGGLARHDRDGKTTDERLLPWLAARGQFAAYVPWSEWIL